EDLLHARVRLAAGPALRARAQDAELRRRLPVEALREHEEIGTGLDLDLDLAARVAIDRLDLAHSLLGRAVQLLEHEVDRLRQARLADLVRAVDDRDALVREAQLPFPDAAIVRESEPQDPHARPLPRTEMPAPTACRDGSLPRSPASRARRASA